MVDILSNDKVRHSNCCYNSYSTTPLVQDTPHATSKHKLCVDSSSGRDPTKPVTHVIFPVLLTFRIQFHVGSCVRRGMYIQYVLKSLLPCLYVLKKYTDKILQAFYSVLVNLQYIFSRIRGLRPSSYCRKYSKSILINWVTKFT